MSAVASAVSQGFSESAAPALPVVNLAPNAYYVTARDEVISTVLGSCIAVCIRDSHTGIGGSNHFMLPLAAGYSRTSALSLRYGPCAMRALLSALYAAGADHSRLEAKIFGGGQVLAALAATRVGAANIDFVRHDLAARGIPVVAEDVGGRWPRRLYYRPATGMARIKRFRQVLPGAFDPATGACMLRRLLKTEPSAEGLRNTP